MSHKPPIQRTDHPLEDFCPGPDELSSLRGLPASAPDTFSCHEQYQASDPAEPARLAEIEQARLDLMLASIEASGVTPSSPATEETRSAQSTGKPVDALSAAPTLAPLPVATVESLKATVHPDSHADKQCDQEAIARIMNEIVRSDIDAFNRKRQS